MLKKFICVIFLSMVSSSNYAQPPQLANSIETSAKKHFVLVAINVGVYNKYHEYLDDAVCERLPNYHLEQIDRALAELFLICMAFEQQNLPVQLKIVPVSNYLRALQMVQAGQVHTIAESIWTVDLKNLDVYASADVIRKGEFEKGIYAYYEHPMLKHPKNDFDISQYVGVTFKSWIHDWAVIQALTPKRRQISHLPSLFKVLKAGRGDFTLMEFSLSPTPVNKTITSEEQTSLELSIWENGIRLSPVLGIKVAIPDSRKLVVSKTASNAPLIFKTLNQGLNALRAQGKIYPVYERIGFINPLTKDWQVIELDQRKISYDANQQKKYNDKFFN